MSDYTKPRNMRFDNRVSIGTCMGGKLVPVSAARVQGNESGLFDCAVTLELAPIAGRMYTKIAAHVQSVFVPLQAIHALHNPEHDYPGEDVVIREQLTSGDPLFPLEVENEVTKRCFVHPKSIDGVKKLCASTRLAHIAAVNFLRRSKYHKATLLDSAAMGITPAILGQTVLDRFNAVLDPDDHINGSVQFDLPNVQLPVSGIGLSNNSFFNSASANTRQTGGVAAYVSSFNLNSNQSGTQTLVVEEDPSNPGFPNVKAEGDLSGSQMSISDFYKAETRDRITRHMEGLIKNNPEHGELYALRWAHGLRLDATKTPFKIFDEEMGFGYSMKSAMDGDNLDKEQTESDLTFDFTVPIPKTEFGGVVVTFVTVKPDETLEYQPHPIMSEPWVGTKYTEEELVLDPVKVTNREISADVVQGEENTPAFYTAYNGMKMRYTSYGFDRRVDRTKVANRSALWQINMPTSVTPETILYPDELDNYPFGDWDTDIVTSFTRADFRIATPMIVGPSPVEKVDIIEDQDLFGEDEEV